MKITRKLKNSSRKTKKISRKTNGGSYCVFEEPANWDKYGCNTECSANEPCKQTNRFYYYPKGDTLFGFKSHIFKHLDDYEININDRKFCTLDTTRKKRVYYPKDGNIDDPNIKTVIDAVIGLIESDSMLNYTDLKNSSESDGTFYTKIIMSSDSPICVKWLKKTKPKFYRVKHMVSYDKYEKIKYFVHLISFCNTRSPDIHCYDPHLPQINDKSRSLASVYNSLKVSPKDTSVHVPITHKLTQSQQKKAAAAAAAALTATNPSAKVAVTNPVSAATTPSAVSAATTPSAKVVLTATNPSANKFNGFTLKPLPIDEEDLKYMGKP